MYADTEKGVRFASVKAGGSRYTYACMYVCAYVYIYPHICIHAYAMYIYIYSPVDSAPPLTEVRYPAGAQDRASAETQ
jgi:hypothetical protein